MPPIIPSYLYVREDNFSNMVNHNDSLKIGTVIDVTLPEGGEDSADNTSPPLPPFPLYTVLVSEKVNDVTVNIPFKNCLLRDIFGSTPDFFEFSLRKSTFSSNSSASNSTGPTGSLEQLQKDSGTPAANSLLGATVLIQCINGSTFNAIILGAVRTYNNNFGYGQGYTPVNDQTGKYLTFAFNGILFNINDSGELTLKRIGPTDNDGTVLTKDSTGDTLPANNEGSTIRVDKSGAIEISAGTNDADENGDNKNYTPMILLEKSGKITIASGVDNDNALNPNDNSGVPNNAIEIKPDGSIDITINKGLNLQLTDNGDSATLTLGSGSNSATVAENLQTLYNQLLQQLQTLTVSTAFGPSSVPINAGAFPAWASNIISQSMKIPK